MIHFTPDQIVASLIVLAYFAGGLMGAAIVYYIQCKIENAPKHRKQKIDWNDDLELVAKSVGVLI